MEQWLQNLDQATAVIVPTRSLANNLSERIAENKLAQGLSVWEAPNILLWSDYIKLLWQSNRDVLTVDGVVCSLITPQQSLLLWTQIVASSRRQEQSLTLLNVQQTAKALQRSWRLLYDWKINLQDLANDHAADTQQFIEWVESYRHLLKQRGLFDEQLLATQLLSIEHALPFKKVIWYAYDLITASQHAFIRFYESQGIEIEFKNTQISDERSTHSRNNSYFSYANQKQELISVLKSARSLIEQDENAAINIVIPDLQHRQAQVRDIARDVFYPAKSPLELQQSHNVYRFSLGEPLKQWPAIETALTLLSLFKNRVKISDLGFILQNRFLRKCQQYADECRVFDKWLKGQRVSTIKVEAIVDYYQACLLHYQQRGKPVEQNGLLEFLQEITEQQAALQTTLSEAKISTGFAALSFHNWAQQITDWLNVWGWSATVANSDMSSVQFQLAQRWQALLKELSELSIVQKQVGQSRLLEIVQQMAHDGVFLPKAPASPILISGVYEAIGRPATACYLIGMDDQYPQPAQSDVFIPNRLMQQANYPEASHQGSFQQAMKVMQSLLSAAQQVSVSYALHKQQDREVEYSVSALFRESQFELQSHNEESSTPIELEDYEDNQAPAWPSGSIVEGGSAIFENQSNCAFKAFVTHQLKYSREEEAEFGLDNLDRGNIVHSLLDELWGRLHTQAELKSLSLDQRLGLIEQVVDKVLRDERLVWGEEKKILLRHEKPRLIKLLAEWLDVEIARPTEFSVVDREEKGSAVYAGIAFNYIIDRLDVLSDGRTVIIDYKTGLVARGDWLNDRIRRPQLPLYALAHDEKKRTPVSGIAFANVKQNESKYLSLSEVGIFRNGRWAENEERDWVEHRAEWPEIFSQLAKDFLAGDARVNPIDEKTCSYCDLQSICRVSQLRAQTESSNDKGGVS